MKNALEWVIGFAIFASIWILAALAGLGTGVDQCVGPASC